MMRLLLSAAAHSSSISTAVFSPAIFMQARNAFTTSSMLSRSFRASALSIGANVRGVLQWGQIWNSSVRASSDIAVNGFPHRVHINDCRNMVLSPYKHKWMGPRAPRGSRGPKKGGRPRGGAGSGRYAREGRNGAPPPFWLLVLAYGLRDPLVPLEHGKPCRVSHTQFTPRIDYTKRINVYRGLSLSFYLEGSRTWIW